MTKILQLDLEGIPESEHDRVKQEIGDILVEGINDALDRSTTPVAGGTFTRRKKDGTLSELLDLGDLRSAIEARPTGDGVEVGVFDASETPKAYGHNTDFEGHRFLAGKGNKREFIPGENGGFKKPIMDRVNQVLRNFRDAAEGLTIDDLLALDEGAEVSTGQVRLTIGDLLFGGEDGEG